MEKLQNTIRLYSLEDNIGSFRILDALPYSVNPPEHDKPFVDTENYLLSMIELAKKEYQSSQDKSLSGLYVGAQSAITAANEALQAEGKDRK